LLSSDPHAWLRDLFARLDERPGFRLLAPSHQFEQLAQAVAVEHPAKAAAMREWSVAAQHNLLIHLASMVEQKQTASRVELWTAQKDDRHLRCVAVYLPTGIDVRLMEGEKFRRTQLCKDAPETRTLSTTWRAALRNVGWTATDDVLTDGST
jgi:hypothetical protein